VVLDVIAAKVKLESKGESSDPVVWKMLSLAHEQPSKSKANGGVQQ
jgi:hypothetical protein